MEIPTIIAVVMAIIILIIIIEAANNLIINTIKTKITMMKLMIWQIWKTLSSTNLFPMVIKSINKIQLVKFSIIINNDFNTFFFFNNIVYYSIIIFFFKY